MKRLAKCRVTIFLLAGWAALSVLGYMGRNDIYKAYQKDVRTTPYFVMVFEGIHDGIWPWMMSGTPWSQPGEHVTGNVNGGDDGRPGPDAGGVPETEALTDPAGTEAPNPAGSTESAGGTAGTEGTETAGGTAGAGETVLPREFVQVDESWFDDAVFIGDSRTVGLRDYGGLDTATFYATVGMNVYDLWEEAFCEVDGEKMTLADALTAKQYGKVYFQIGINEMGTGTIDSFMQEYAAAVERIKELQPNAVIYVQGIMRVTQKKSDSDPIFNNRGILLRNERIALLADNVRVFYIDVNEAVCNDAGNLREDLTFDDLHLYGSKYGIWVDFLLSKGIGEISGSGQAE